MTQIRLRAFGAPGVHRDGVACPAPLRKGLALLVYLAAAQGPVSREAAATLMWPDADAELGRTRLRRLWHRLQLAIGPDALVADRTVLRWSPAVDLEFDVELFEKACARGEFELACRIYGDDFLADFPVDGCAQFEEWAFFRREALRGLAMQALERVVHEAAARGDYAAAVVHARRLVALDPLSEVYARHLLRNLLRNGDRATAARHLEVLTQRLQEELGVTPEAETCDLLAEVFEPAQISPPEVRYARSGGVHLAYQTYGAGDLDILLLPGFVSHVERLWEEPHSRRFLAALSRLGRLVLFDRRGVGLSDRLGDSPTIEATARDIGAVLDAAGSRRAVLFGASEGGPACLRFAADRPDRVTGLVLFAALAKGSAAADYPQALNATQYDRWLKQLMADWGGPAGLETFAPSLASNPVTRAWWAGLLRAASSPGALKGVLEALRDTDVRPLLSKISAPTLVLHRRRDRAVRIDASRYLAQHIPGARLVELDGDDHWAFAGDQQSVLDQVAAFTRTFAV